MKIIVTALLILTCLLAIPAFAQSQTAAPFKPSPSWLSADQMHADYVKRVIDSPGFGASRMPAVFREVTEMTLEGETYRVKRVSLIGIAEHASPVAFVSPRSIPRLGDLTNATFRAQIKTRALTGFEKAALPKLQAGSESVVDLKSGLVVGAMRARQDCLKCHEVKAGTLLGALSYELATGEAGLLGAK